ncbi:MAG: DUF2069 domain-containing protein [Betaproteobacteria bacterium]|nr:DUF2069 domain-containing protein [Betaproteobacteria bacterium]
MIRFAYVLTCSSLIALTLLCVAWESFLAPLRPGGSLLMLKSLPLLAPLFGILRERLYSYRWSSFLALAYFTEGVVRAWSDRGLSQRLAITEVVLSLMFFAGCLLYVRSRLRRAAPSA